MNKQKNTQQSLFVTIAGIASLLVFMGAGCQKNPPPPSSNTQTGNNYGEYTTTAPEASNDSTDAKFNKAIDVEVPDTKDKVVADQLQGVVSSVFGKTKLSGFATDLVGTGSLSLEFTFNRVTAPEDVRKLSDALKAKGYHIDQTNVYDGTAVVQASNKSAVQINFSFSLGEQTLMLLYYPQQATQE